MIVTITHSSPNGEEEHVEQVEYITLDEAACGYRLAPSTVYSYSSSGALPPIGHLPDGTPVMERQEYERTREEREYRRLNGRRGRLRCRRRLKHWE